LFRKTLLFVWINQIQLPTYFSLNIHPILEAPVQLEQMYFVVQKEVLYTLVGWELLQLVQLLVVIAQEMHQSVWIKQTHLQTLYQICRLFLEALCTTGTKVLCGPLGSPIFSRWIGTAPACGVSCNDCNGDLPVCMDVTNSHRNSLSNLSITFGATCVTGTKALCGPIGSTVYPRWVGTAPACGASCADCVGDVPVCMDMVNTPSATLSNFSSTFGSPCSTGSKVLCGPIGSTVYPRWVGTAPACVASGADCYGDTPVLMDLTNTITNAISAQNVSAYFGAPCYT
jgi:hypothetical protein